MFTQKVDFRKRSYDIRIASQSINYLPRCIRELNETQKNVIIVTDINVADLYLNKITFLLNEAGYEVYPLILPVGERTKSFEAFEKVARFCLKNKVERNHAIIALGGGVIGDLVGFVASTIRRGCRFIQIPTTLLAQVDSSVGGKTAINTPEGKNLVGAFYQPSAVIIDIDFLASLPERDYRSGYAEVIKYGLLGDKEFFDYLSDNNRFFINRDKAFLQKIITHSVKMKAEIVMRDENELGERALLNLGHTFAHVYEAFTGYSDILLHGEAVAIGMYHAARLSAFIGKITEDDVKYIHHVLLNAGFELNLRHFIKDFSVDNFIDYLSQDKKNTDNLFVFILLNKIGQSYIDKSLSPKYISNNISKIINYNY